MWNRSHIIFVDCTKQLEERLSQHRNLAGSQLLRYYLLHLQVLGTLQQIRSQELFLAHLWPFLLCKQLFHARITNSSLFELRAQE